MRFLRDETGSTLNSVVVPCLASDIPKIAPTLSVWLSDRFAPSLTKRRKRPIFMIVFNRATAEEVAETEAILKGLSNLTRYFRGFEVHSANLDGDMDIYVRNSHVASGQYGNKAGPNFLFQRAMHLAGRHGSFTFQMELDCLPVAPGWLDKLAALLTYRHAWVIGTPYLGDRQLDRRVQFHLNGNALYHCGAPEFLDFLDDVWMARLHASRASQPNLAYDCWFSYEMTRANAIVRNRSWDIWQRYALYFHSEPYIVNLNVQAYEIASYLGALKSLRDRGFDPILFHGPGIAELVETLAADHRLGLKGGIKKVAEALQDSAQAQEYGGLSDIDEQDEGMASYPSFIVPTAGQNGDGVPRILLNQGFHQIEGPSSRFYPVRYVWTADSAFEIIPFSTGLGIPLMFRNGDSSHMTPDTLPSFKVTQNGHELSHKTELMEHPVYARLHISAKNVQPMLPITVTCDAEIFEEASARKRRLGVLLLETGVKFAEF